jgi:hypothetical protein
MTNSPTENNNSSTGTTIVAGLVVGLLLIVAALNLPAHVITPVPTATQSPSATFSPSPPTAPPIPTPNMTLQSASSTANLVLGNVSFHDALPLTCGKTVQISVDVANRGGEPTTTTGSIIIRDVVSSSGKEAGSTSGAFGPINNGQTVNVSGIFLLVVPFAGEEHKLIVTVNPDGSVPETSSSDNSREFTYILQGDCG